MGETPKMVVRSLLALGTVGVALYLAIEDREVPPWLTAVVGGQLLDWYYAVRKPE